ncbi:MAG: nucleotidyl transferase AbiEii/AbiGii toxin family protein [Planctomycetes bacterium]|nr:nucleotidyl transferase AbiEii/AbiGii toxin family protein [Planctomycetota bacterium]
MDYSPGLSPLQRDLLREFFARERRFVLTGGGALVGYHLRHRTSDDLDLFAKPPVDIEDARRAMTGAAAALGATVESLRTYPDFVRLLVRRGDETAIVDLVIDRAPDVDEPIDVADGVRIHSLREIASNKICALLGRGEVRDLIDLRAILAHGVDLEVALADAEQKDGGVSAATLAWILDQVAIGAQAKLPGVTPDELEKFRTGLVQRLRRLARPSSD